MVLHFGIVRGWQRCFVCRRKMYFVFWKKEVPFFSIHSFELIHSFIHVSYACNSKCIVISMRSVKFKRCCACALRNVDFVSKPFENETKWNTFQLFTFTIVISRRLVLITQQRKKECFYFFVACKKSPIANTKARIVKP